MGGAAFAEEEAELDGDALGLEVDGLGQVEGDGPA
jgi:hypothetical protein